MMKFRYQEYFARIAPRGHSMSIATASPTARRSAVADKAQGALNGYLMLVVGLTLIIVAGWLIADAIAPHGFASYQFGLRVAGAVVAVVLLSGLIVLQPNESLVCLLFGSYVGTEHRPGFWWVNPFNSKRKVSRRLETLECGPLKVNDAIGNPVDFGAVVVWRVDAALGPPQATSGRADRIQSTLSRRERTVPR
jgi:hypothetical protein